MKKQICVEFSIIEHLRKFIEKEKIDIEIISGQHGDIEITKCDEPKESNLDIIYSGGWITCETARSVAKILNISLSQMGKMLNHMDVKIRSCSLGCFK